MTQIREILGCVLQARLELERGDRTVIELLRERMDGVDRPVRRPTTLKERLGFNLKALGCCGVSLGLGPTTMAQEEEDIGGPETDDLTPAQDNEENGPPACAVTGMNLAAALAAERQLRAVLDSDIGPSPETPGTPARVSLMRLLEETDGCDGEVVVMRRRSAEEEERGGCAWVCCVCMGRKKGAAFIPCGHTFCRVCSRELWLNRGSCPLCNRPILEILDIY